jgi:hypothetical protein
MEAHDFSYAEASADARAYSGDDLFIAESNPSATECVDQRAGFATASMSMPVARPEPSTLAETGIPEPILLDLLLKTMHETSLNTVSQISDFYQAAAIPYPKLARYCRRSNPRRKTRRDKLMANRQLHPWSDG